MGMVTDEYPGDDDDNETLKEFVHGRLERDVKECPFIRSPFAKCRQEICQMWDTERNDCGLKQYPPIPYETLKVGEIIEQKPAPVEPKKTIYTTKGKRTAKK